jgi:hypothetical protein
VIFTNVAFFVERVFDFLFRRRKLETGRREVLIVERINNNLKVIGI